MAIHNDPNELSARAIDEISRAFEAAPSVRTMQVEVGKHLTGIPEVDRIILDWSERTMNAWLSKRA